MKSIPVPIFDICLVLRRDERYAQWQPVEAEWHSSFVRPKAVSRALNQLPPDADVIVLARDQVSGRFMAWYDRDRWINNNIEALFRKFLRDGTIVRYLRKKSQRFLAEERQKMLTRFGVSDPGRIHKGH